MPEVLDRLELVKKLASIEGEGVAFYESLAEHAEDEKVRKLASTMARVEKQHQRRFEELAQKFEGHKTKEATGQLTASVRQYIHTLIDHRIFLSPEQAERIGKEMKDENEAVAMAIRFEKENILLLLECKELVRGETRKLIATFIEQEKAHIRSLRRIWEQLTKMGKES